MKQFNLKEYLANPSRKVITRDGQNVKIHCTNFIGSQSIIGQVEGYAFSISFSEDGRCANDRVEHPLDLFFAPEKKEGWVNLFRDSTDNEIYCSKVYPTKEKAMNSIGAFYATIKIEWEE